MKTTQALRAKGRDLAEMYDKGSASSYGRAALREADTAKGVVCKSVAEVRAYLDTCRKKHK